MTLVYYGDLECPICKQFTLGALPTDHPEVGAHGQGEDRIPLAGDGHARTGNVQDPAGRGAGGRQAEQDVELHRDLLPRAGRRGLRLRDRKLPPGARQPGSRLEPRRNGAATAANRCSPTQVASDAQAASNAGFTGTPSFLIGRTGGALQKLEYSSLTDPAGFDEAIEKQLQAQLGRDERPELRITLIVLTVIGVGARQLPDLHPLRRHQAACARAGGSCLKVQNSIYSKLAGVPVALIGLIGYIAILGSLLVPENETSRLATVAFTLDRLRLQRIPDLPRAVLDPRDLRVVRVERRDHDRDHVPVGLALPARRPAARLPRRRARAARAGTQRRAPSARLQLEQPPPGAQTTRSTVLRSVNPSIRPAQRARAGDPAGRPAQQVMGSQATSTPDPRAHANRRSTARRASRVCSR